MLLIEIRVDKAAPKTISAAYKMLPALHLSDPCAYRNLPTQSNSLESPPDFIHVTPMVLGADPAADYLLHTIYSG